MHFRWASFNKYNLKWQIWKRVVKFAWNESQGKSYYTWREGQVNICIIWTRKKYFKELWKFCPMPHFHVGISLYFKYDTGFYIYIYTYQAIWVSFILNQIFCYFFLLIQNKLWIFAWVKWHKNALFCLYMLLYDSVLLLILSEVQIQPMVNGFNFVSKGY